MKHLFTLLFLVPALWVQAQTVSIEGGQTYNTIQEAIDAAIDNDVINISGTFTENILIQSKSLTLKGSNPATDIIDGGSSGRVVNIYSNSLKNVTIENLSIKNGNPSSGRGGGIHFDIAKPNPTADPPTTANGSGSSLTLNNVIVEDNYAPTEGGAIAMLGANLTLNSCTINNNSSGSSGGGMLFTSKGTLDMNIEINNSLLSNNTSNNGGGIYVNGNNDSVNVNVEITNTTVTGNTATTTGEFAAGGGAIWSKVKNGLSNVTLKLVHVTIDNNTHGYNTTNGETPKAGLTFTGGGTNPFTKVEIYNSIIVNGEATAKRAINWAKAKPLNIVNSIIGGSSNASSAVDGVAAIDFLDEPSLNNQKGSTTTDAGIATTLSDRGGSTQVLALGSGTLAVNFCTAATTGITLPTDDQRGFTRSDGTLDAGAFEFNATAGLFDFKDSLPFSVYPNPASQFIHIDADVEVKSVKIYSLLGALEKSIQDATTIDVSDLNKGVHLLVVKSDGKQSAKQLIIE